MKENFSSYRVLYLLIAFAILEVFMLSYWKGHFGIYLSPIVFFLASFGVSITGIYLSTKLKNQVYESSINRTGLVISFLLVLTVVYIGYSVFSAQFLDDTQSDVIAQVVSPSRWLLHGEYPYQQVVLPTYSMHNTYLPMQWFPFVFSLGFGFDPRWIPLVAWALSFLLFVKTVGLPFNFSRGWLSKLRYIIVSAISVSIVGAFIFYNPFDYSVTIELLPSAYYILLALSLLSGSWIFMGISMGVCLMSRFSILLFIPFLMWYVYKRFGLPTLMKSSGICVSFILLVFVLPFMTKDASLPQKILGNYDSGSLGEWSTHTWQEPGAEPYQLSRGIGAAIFVKKLYEYSAVDGIRHLKQAMIIGCLFVSFFMIYLFQRNQDWMNQDWILLGGMKLYLTVFYTLVLIPYPYLYFLPLSFTSILIVKAYSDISNQQAS
jgi:hypothetical protein